MQHGIFPQVWLCDKDKNTLSKICWAQGNELDNL